MAGNTPISDVPDAPTIGTVTVTSATVVSVPFTAAATGGAPTSYSIVSNPSIAITTQAGTTSPLTATGTFASNTSYTFTIKGVNSTATGAASAASNAVTPLPAYTLAQTFNSSGNYTVPSGKNLVSFAGAGAGAFLLEVPKKVVNGMITEAMSYGR